MKIREKLHYFEELGRRDTTSCLAANVSYRICKSLLALKHPCNRNMRLRREIRNELQVTAVGASAKMGYKSVRSSKMYGQ